MKLVYSWLREYCPTDLSPEELGDVLSAKGAHLESLDRPWEGLEGVVVARVLEVRDHPNSDSLCLARVDTGSGEQEVVVGVRNMVAGDLVPLAGPGARVPALSEPLGARTIRGVVSNGMLCSPRELAISPEHLGILILNETGLDPGTDLRSALGLDDAVLDLEIESNRPDLLSVIGLAREVSAATGVPLGTLDVSVSESDDAAADVATVQIVDEEGCPRYLVRAIRGVSSAPAPIRIQARLTAAGVRPLSAVVDATNYVMLEMGQPLHAFDLARLSGQGIVVRSARDGERLTTLDDVERELEPDDLLICDLEQPVALAGVMGGRSSEVSGTTSDVLLESAYFDPRRVLRTSRRLFLPTEAAIRFSRGVDPEGVAAAASRAARLMAEWAGGKVLSGVVEAGAAPPRRIVGVRPTRASLLAGHEIDGNDVIEAFARLGIAASSAGGTVEVEVPGYRPDLEREVDLIEEVIRVQGYDRVGSTFPSVKQVGGEAPSYAFRRRMRERLARAGLREAPSLSFASESDIRAMGSADPIRVANPPSADQPFLRTSLLPNLVRAVARNADRGVRSAALFEVGHVFRAGDPIDEREHVAAAMAGPASEGLHSDDRVFDVLDAKGALESLLEGLGIEDWRLGDPAALPYHPGRSAEIVAGDRAVGTVGELHPRVAEAFGVTARVAVFEVDADALAPLAGGVRAFRDVPRFPPVRRDLAFVVPRDAPAGAVGSALEEAGGELLDRCVLFDVFEGGALDAESKSLAFSLEFRAPDRTLTDDEAEAAVGRIVARLEADFGARLRAG